MKSLSERLADFKVMKSSVCEVHNGFKTDYYDMSAKVVYRPVDGHYIVELRERNLGGRKEILRVLDKEEKDKIMEVCYNEMIGYLRTSTHVECGKLLPKNVFPFVDRDGKIISYANCTSQDWLDSANGVRTTSFGKLSREERAKVNWERAKRGLSPAAVSVRV